MSNFPERLKEVRGINKHTQKQVAQAIGIAERQYQVYEYGNVDPSYKVIIKLCRHFNVSADYLLGLSDVPISLE